MSLMTLIRRDDGVATLTMDRPPVNAMNLAFLQDLIAAVAAVAADPPGALVIAGTERAFSAGADLREMPGYGADEQRRMVIAINDMCLGVYGLPFPVVGALTGHAIAGGMVLALCTDLRIASATGRYGLTEVSVGVPYPAAALGVTQAELAPAALRRLALGGALHGPQDLLALGVIDEVAGDAALVLDRAQGLAATLAALPGETFARTKRDLRGPLHRRLVEQAAAEPLLAQAP